MKRVSVYFVLSVFFVSAVSALSYNGYVHSDEIFRIGNFSSYNWTSSNVKFEFTQNSKRGEIRVDSVIDGKPSRLSGSIKPFGAIYENNQYVQFYSQFNGHFWRNGDGTVRYQNNTLYVTIDKLNNRLWVFGAWQTPYFQINNMSVKRGYYS